MITHTGTLHRLLFPSLLWRMPGRKVFLTFDDGPHPSATPAVLDALQRHGVRGTFFLTGRNIPGNEELVRRIVREGHAIGIHAFNHSRLLAFSRARTREEILRTAELIRGITGTAPRTFRPPFGFFSWNTIAAAKELGMLLVMWSCLTGDFRNRDPRVSAAAALSRLGRGSILVFHDNDLTAARIGDVLDLTIPGIAAKGFECGVIR